MSLNEILHNSILNQESLQLLIQTTRDIIVILEADSTIRYISPAVKSILGYQPVEAQGQHALTYVHPEDKEYVEASLKYMLEANSFQPCSTARYRHANGHYVYLEILGTNLFDEPNIRGLVLNCRDVTKNKLTEKTLHESERNLQKLYTTTERQAQELALLERIRTALAGELELGSLFRTVVAAIAETFGYTQVSLYLLEEDKLILQHQVGYKHVLSPIPLKIGVMGRAVRTGQPILLEDVQTDPEFLGAIGGIVSEISVPLFDGKKCVGSLNVESTNQVKLTQADLQLILALSEHLNIAISRARLHEEVRSSERQYRSVVDNIKEIIFQIDLAGNWTFLNPAWTSLTGFEVSESIGRNFLEYITPIEPPTSEILLKAIADNKGTYVTHLALCRTKHSKPLWIEGYVHLVLDENGQSNSIAGVMHDFTEKKEAELKLKQREQEFRALVENAPDVIARYDRQMRHVYINPAVTRISGLLPSQYIGKTTQELGFQPELNSFWGNKFEQVFEIGQEQEITYQLPVEDGDSFKYFQSRLVPELDETGMVVSVLSISREITKLKETENALRDSEASFRMLFANSPLPLYVYDLDSLRFLEVNDTAIQQYGFSREEFMHLTIADLRPVEDIPILVEEIAKARNNVNQIKFWRHFRKNGELIDVEVNTHTIEFAGKKALLVVAQDITARKQAEDALAEERERLTVTLRSISEGVITTDTNGCITLLNKAAETLIGWKQDEVVGQPLIGYFKIVESSTSKPPQNPIIKALQEGSNVESNANTLLTDRNGIEKLIAYTSAPIYDKESRIVGAVLAFQDITEKQKLADERLKASKLESLGLLAGGVAHDFNNLMTAVLSNVALARALIDGSEADKTVEAHNTLQAAEKAVLRARDLTRQLLTFAKGGAPIKTTAMLPEIIIESANFVLHGSKVVCNYNLSDDLWPVEVDKSQLSQVMQNLVINAVQAMPRGGHIYITGENIVLPPNAALDLAAGKYVKISVRDEGVGIPPDQLSKIFDPYYTTKAHGTGLGLATSYSIIRQHDGCISVHSLQGHGTTFELFLPSSVKNFTTEVRPKTNPLWANARGRILVMDDEEIIRTVMSKILKQIGYEVVLTKDGNEAIEAYQKSLEEGQPFAVVVMDLTIRGGMGGKETINKLLEINPHVKAIVSSGYSNDPILANYQEYGFKGVVVKPFRMEELLDSLREVMSQ